MNLSTEYTKNHINNFITLYRHFFLQTLKCSQADKQFLLFIYTNTNFKNYIKPSKWKVTSCLNVDQWLKVLVTETKHSIRKNWKKVENITHLIPLSVNKLGSSCKTIFSKKSLLISGSRSGSSPINWKTYYY